MPENCDDFLGVCQIRIAGNHRRFSGAYVSCFAEANCWMSAHLHADKRINHFWRVYNCETDFWGASPEMCEEIFARRW